MRKIAIVAGLCLAFAGAATAANGASGGDHGIGASHVPNVGAILLSPVTTVALLPVCGPASTGVVRAVSDANATTFGSTVAGGGSTKLPVFCNGTNWIEF